MNRIEQPPIELAIVRAACREVCSADKGVSLIKTDSQVLFSTKVTRADVSTQTFVEEDFPFSLKDLSDLEYACEQRKAKAREIYNDAVDSLSDLRTVREKAMALLHEAFPNAKIQE